MDKCFLLAIALALLCACSRDSKHQAQRINAGRFERYSFDTEFAVNAADQLLLGIRTAELAQGSRTGKDAAYLIKIHSDYLRWRSELNSLAGQKKISLPSFPGRESQNILDALAGKTAGELPDACMDVMIKNEKNMIYDFKKESEKGHDKELKTWANGLLQDLKGHL